VFVRNVSHVGCSECDTVRSLGNLEHLFYESTDRLQFISDVLSLLDCAACGSDGGFCQSLPEVSHGTTNSRFKKLFIIVKMKMKLMKRFL
jgi:hypothetical protein